MISKIFWQINLTTFSVRPAAVNPQYGGQTEVS